MQLKVNTDEVVKYTRQLEQMRKYDFPLAVRGALNSAAYDVKKIEMPASAQQHFIHRKPNFFKATSRVEKADGFNVGGMRSMVGFMDQGGTDYAVDDLQQQEHGGGIKGRSFIPTEQARVSGSWTGNVRKKHRISANKGRLVDARDAKGKNDKEKFVKSAIYAGKGGYVIGTEENAGTRMVFEIRSIIRKKVKKKKGTVIKAVPIYALKSGRVVRPKATHFMKEASLRTAKKLPDFYIKEAKRRFEKRLRK